MLPVAGESNTVLDLIQTGEGAAPPAKKEVKIVGDTSILATLRTFGTGGDLFSVSDKSNGIGMVRCCCRLCVDRCSTTASTGLIGLLLGVWYKLEPKGPHAPETTRHYQGYLDQ